MGIMYGVISHFFGWNLQNLSAEPSSLVFTSLAYSGNDEDSKDPGFFFTIFLAGIFGIFAQNPAPKPKCLRPSLLGKEIWLLFTMLTQPCA